MKKVFIGFDLDGVILDHAPIKIRVAKSFGFNIKKRQTPSEIINKIIIPRSVYEQFKDEVYSSLDTRLISGAVNFLNKLQKNKISFALISRRKKSDTPIQLLKKYELWPKYFNKNNVYFVEKPEDKDIKAIELGVTHYIDDEPKVLAKLASVKNKYLFDPIGAYKNTAYKHVSSWKELKSAIFRRM